MPKKLYCLIMLADDLFHMHVNQKLLVWNLIPNIIFGASLRCKITANSGYNPDSAAIIARKLINIVNFFMNYIKHFFRNGYIQRFSYNCTQYSRNGLRKTGFFDSNSESASIGSIGSSSITSLGSYVIICINLHSKTTYLYESINH